MTLDLETRFSLNKFMLKRIFVAINLPENIKKELMAFKEKWQNLICKWTKKENLHLTLIFIGYIKPSFLKNVFEATENVCQKYSPFFLNLKEISFGPPQKRPPRMIWVKVEKNPDLINLQKELKNSIFKNSLSEKFKLELEKEDFFPHITLARIKTYHLRQMEEIPEIKEKINLKFKVNFVEIMESKLKREGPQYFVLQRFPLSKI